VPPHLLSDPIAAVVQLNRLREVLALTGFTRFEAVVPDTDGEYETDVERASLAVEPEWFPAVENRDEGVFIQLDFDAGSSVPRSCGGSTSWLAVTACGPRTERRRGTSPAARTSSCTRWPTC